jgi:signal transduction histidine kinase
VRLVPNVSLARIHKIILSPSLWLVFAMLLSAVLFHYSAQLRTIPFPIRGQTEVTRHATERVLLILPIGYAAFALGPRVGLAVLAAAFLIMLPRALLLSDYPADAFLEATAVTLVGGLTVWLAWIKRSQEILREKATARLQALNAVSAVLGGSLELKSMLGEALDTVLEVMGFEAGAIFILDDRHDDLILAAHRGLPPGLAESHAGLSLARAVVTDPALHSQIGLPLKSKGRPLGAIVVGNSQEHHFAPQEVELLEAIASEIGVAAENARLHRNVTRQLERERRLGEVAEGITSEIELGKVLSRVVQIAERLVEADAGVIALLDETKGVIRYPYLHNLPQELMQVTVAPDQGLAGQVISTGSPTTINDYLAYGARVEAFVKDGVKSVVAVPIATSGRVFGALEIISVAHSRDFSDRDVAVLSSVARQAAVAIENARLYEAMRSYARQILTAQEEERKRIARELHDDTAQGLVALSRQLDALLSATDGDAGRAKQRLLELRQITAQLSQDVRRFSQDLRPSTLDDLGLLPTLEALTARMSTEDHIEANLQVSGEKRRLSPEVELVLFRITQEALANVRKHSGATKVLTTVEFGDGVVRVEVSDDGQGFTVPAKTDDLVKTGKLGLTGMLERAHLAGGTLEVHSQPGAGTRVVAEIPA